MRTSLDKYPGAFGFSNCLGLTDKDRVLILSDKKASRKPIELVASACRKFAKKVECSYQLPLRLQKDISRTLNKKIINNDVIILAARQSWYQTPTRKKAKYELKKRVAECYCLNMEMLVNGALCADYKVVSDLTKRVFEFFKGGKYIRLTTESGTDLCAQIKNYSSETGIYKTPGSGGNLPAGEVSLGLKEKSAEGRIVVDLSIDVLGIIKRKKIEIIVEEGCIKTVGGENNEKLKYLLKKSPSLKNITEIGIGTNRYAILGRSVLEDEKKYGTAHIGFGNNTYFGGRITGPHYDCVLLGPNIKIDGRKIK